MKRARKMSRKLLSASIRGMILPKARRSLIGRLWLTAVILGPMIYLGGKARTGLRIVGPAERKAEPVEGLGWQW